MDSTDAPIVSVIIPVYNGADTIGAQLSALAEQADAPHFEVIVADNGSSDATLQVVQNYTDLFDQLIIVDAAQKRGAAFARNEGLLVARGKIVAFCDADDIVAADWVSQFARAIQSDVIGSGWIDFRKLNDDEGSANSDTETTLPVISGYLPSIGSGNVALARTAALAIGGFDESFIFGVEDIDFGWRAQQYGLRLIKVPALLHCRLRSDPHSVFKQNRSWGRGNIMLRLRHQDFVPNAMSFKYSAFQLLKQCLSSLRLWFRRDQTLRREQARKLGMSLGEFEGHVIFRILGRLPAPATLNSRTGTTQ